MTITKERNGNELTISIEGRIDATTAPELNEEIKTLDDVESLVFNLENCEYVSSAGLRSLLSAEKIMNKQGSMVIRNVSEQLRSIFMVTGFIDILNIE